MNTSKLLSYNRTIAVVKDLTSLVNEHTNISYYLRYQSHLNLHEILNYLRTDTYPDIHPVMNLVSEKGRGTIWGHTPPNKNYIEVRENLLMGLEYAKQETTIMATGFLVAVTLIHELVHFGRNHKGVIEDTRKDVEPGNTFEFWAFGNYIDNDSAIRYYDAYTKSFTHLKKLIKDDKSIIRSFISH